MGDCKICLFEELRGIILQEMPDESLLQRLRAKGINNLVDNTFKNVQGGVAAAFWGVDDMLQYARIYDLDNSGEVVPQFNVDSKGKIIIPAEVCSSAPSDPAALEEAIAMKQLLQQSVDYMGWQTAADREDKYFVITPYRGCCRLGKGGYVVDLIEFKRGILSVP